jgi:hypothetical protein
VGAPTVVANQNDSVILSQFAQISVPDFTTGIEVSGRFDTNAKGDDVLAAPGPSHAPLVRIFKTNTLTPGGSFQP